MRAERADLVIGQEGIFVVVSFVNEGAVGSCWIRCQCLDGAIVIMEALKAHASLDVRGVERGYVTARREECRGGE